MRVAFVTAIIGAYEATCKKPAAQTFPCDFIVYTDNPSIETHGVWRVVDATQYQAGLGWDVDTDPELINSLVSNPHSFNRAKMFKLNLQRLPELEGYDVVVWVDGSIEVHNPACAEVCASLVRAGKNIVLFEHEVWKGWLLLEVASSQVDARYASSFHHGQVQPVQDPCAQYAAYVASGFREGWIRPLTGRASPNDGMWITCFVVFDMRKQETADFLREWWLQNLQHTTNDQISFPYVCWKQRVVPHTLPGHLQDGRFIDGRGHTVTDLYVKRAHGT